MTIKSLLNRGVRGIRDSIPGGYILGRTDTGDGPVHLLKITDILEAAVQRAKARGFGAVTGSITVYVDGLMTDNELIGRVNTTKQITFAGSTISGHADSAPAADASFSIYSNTTLIGHATYPAGVSVPVLSWVGGGGPTVAAGTGIIVNGPSPPDAALSNVSFTFTARPL